MILARAHHGSPAEAVALADAELDGHLTRLDPQLPAVSMSEFWIAVAEAYTTAGRTRQGARAAHWGLDYAIEAHSDAMRYRALGVRAATLALNGEFSAAESAIKQATALETSHHWSFTPASWMQLVGQLLVAGSHQDSGTLAAVSRRARAILPHSARWNALAALADASLAMVEGRFDDGIAIVITATNSVDSLEIPGLLDDFLVAQQATLLVSRGEPRKALALLDGRESSADHTVCFAVQRASAFLQVEDARRALIATEACFASGLHHNLRTLVLVLVRRAIANKCLNHHQAADTAFSDAVHLLEHSASEFTLLTLPVKQVEVLLDRFRTRHPQLSGLADTLHDRVLTAPTFPSPQAIVLPALSGREALVAQQLRTNMTLAGIAESLYVSRDTVKTQATSLYRKLGVTCRADAVNHLERAGFYDYPHPGYPCAAD